MLFLLALGFGFTFGICFFVMTFLMWRGERGERGEGRSVYTKLDSSLRGDGTRRFMGTGDIEGTRRRLGEQCEGGGRDGDESRSALSSLPIDIE